jgi:orotidine-5'-phosphate decarboxylase
MVLGVTVLTSHDEDSTLRAFGERRADKVEKFALDTAKSGAHGIVCSSKELAFLKNNPWTAKLRKVVPGTRSKGVGHHDQQNVTSPADAIEDGADWLVIGREITEAEDPSAVAARINCDVAAALAHTKEGR